MGERPTIIRNGRVLAHATAALEPADILVEAGRIRAIEAPGKIALEGAAVIDAADRILVPGLVNAHTHAHGNLSKGAGDRWTLELLLNAGLWTSRIAALEDKYVTAQLGAVEMLLKGCTAAYDLFVEVPGPTVEGLQTVAQAYHDAGVRVVLAPMLADRTFFAAIPGLLDSLPEEMRKIVGGFSLPPGERSLEVCRAALAAWSFDRDRARLALAPTIPLHCADEMMVAAARLAAEEGLGYHTHLGESKIQAVSGVTRYGVTLTAHLDRLGVLGPNFTAAHAVWLDSDDIARMADRGANVAHNPGSNMRLGSGIAAVAEMQAKGLNVGVGTDGANCSDNLNMFEAMRLASLASHARDHDYERWLSTRDALRMATEGSARALGFEGKLGRIAPGYLADVVFLDAGHVNMTPLHDIANQLVHIEDGAAIDKVMVGGRLVVDGRRILTVDYPALRRRAEAAAERLRSLNADAVALSRRLEPLVGSFCRGLAAGPYHIHRYAAADGHRH